jgi:hypothetical protein
MRERKTGQINVRELIALLSQVDPELLVESEGCDCEDAAGGISVRDNVCLIKRVLVLL